MRKREPWIKFYFSDWRAESRLKLCSRGARSLWLDMLGIMHDADPYGFLVIEGITPTPAQLANLVGDPERQVRAWLDELIVAGVPSIVGRPMPEDVRALIPAGVPDGTILSRKMVRDMQKRVTDQENGRRGGNATLISAKGVKGGDNPPVKPADNGGDKAQKPEARDQKQDNRETAGATPAGEAPIQGHALIAIPDWIPPGPWKDFLEMRQQIQAPMTERGILLTIAELRKLRAKGEDLAAVLNQSTGRSYRGVFRVKQEDDGHGKRRSGARSAHQKHLGGLARMVDAEARRAEDAIRSEAPALAAPVIRH